MPAATAGTGECILGTATPVAGQRRRVRGVVIQRGPDLPWRAAPCGPTGGDLRPTRSAAALQDLGQGRAVTGGPFPPAIRDDAKIRAAHLTASS